MCKTLEKINNIKCYYIDLDKIIGLSSSELKYTLINRLTCDTYIKSIHNKDVTQIVIIDGLILTLNDLNNVIHTCIEFISPELNQHVITFNIHHWNEDREKCLLNDKIRVKSGIRDKSSELTIRYAPYDNIEYYDKTINIIGVTFNVFKHDIFEPNIFDTTIKNYGKQDKNGKYVLTSKSWSGGGTWGDCWGNSGTIEADADLEFIEFDNLLTKICPNITFLQYKQIYNSCVDKESYYESDYYGGSELRYKYTCNLNTLYNKLIEMNIIDETRI